MRMGWLILAVAAVGLGGCVSQPVITDADVVVADEQGRYAVRFSHRDRLLIRDYYRSSLPPGLAKKRRLPPGLEKQLYERGTLPPGLSGERLPQALERQLDRLPEGYARVRVGLDVILLDRRSRVIVDIIRGIND